MDSHVNQSGGIQPMRADQVLGTKHERTIGFHEKEPSLPQYSPVEEMAHAPGLTDEDYEGKPTEEERVTLRRVAGSVPLVAYVICAVEFSERASYFGVSPLISVSRPSPQIVLVACQLQSARSLFFHEGNHATR